MAASTRLALSLLTRDPRRSLASIGAIAASTLALFVCLGFFTGMNDSQARVAAALDGDLVLFGRRTQSVTNFDRVGRMELLRLTCVDRIAELVPIHQGALDLKNPDTGMRKSIQYFAFPPEAHPFRLPGLAALRAELNRPGTIVFDADSRDFFGRITAGMDVEVGGIPVRVVGTVRYGPNFSRHGTIFMSEATLNERLREHRDGVVSLGLVRARPGVRLEELRAELAGKLGGDFEVLTCDDLYLRELYFNVRSTPVGALLGIGLLVALFVGGIVAYQILYTEVTDHLPQFATCKAMGFPAAFLAAVVLQEALFLAILGFVPGVWATGLAYGYIGVASRTSMELTLPRLALGFVLMVGMCAVAGRIALGRALEADPAELL